MIYVIYKQLLKLVEEGKYIIGRAKNHSKIENNIPHSRSVPQCPSGLEDACLSEEEDVSPHCALKQMQRDVFPLPTSFRKPRWHSVISLVQTPKY